VYNDESLKPPSQFRRTASPRRTLWERNNLKPIDVEPGMPRMSEVGSWMEVSSLDSWQDVAHWFWGCRTAGRANAGHQEYGE